jgi:YfiH family protein
MDNWRLEEKNGIKYYKLYVNQPDFENLQCLFITKIGGLAFNSKQPEIFKKNVQLVQDIFSIGQINLLKQIHSDEIYYLKEDFKKNYSLEGDGLFTDKSNLYLGVRVADCLPIYIFSPNKKIIGIVHSGRHGTIKLIILKMIKMIQKQFKINPRSLYYAFGPCIRGCGYEVSKDIVEHFQKIFNEYHITNAFDFRNGKYYLDIKVINQIILEKIGLAKIGDIKQCSYCQKDLFFSARRDNSWERNLAIIGYKK